MSSSSLSRRSVVMLLRLLLRVLLVVVSAQVPPPEDVMSVFNWSITDCNKYDFAKAGGYNKCGVLVFCKTAAGMFGYRQEHNPEHTCTTPGPVIRVEPGIRYLLTLKNSVPGVTTNIHPHGAHVAGDGNADLALRTANFDECIHYNLLILDSSMGGTFWYHSHFHTQARVQVGMGSFGFFIIEDKFDTLIPLGLPGTGSIRSFLRNEKLIIGSKVDDEWYGNGNPDGAHITIYQNEWTRIRVAVSDPIGSSTSLTIGAGYCEDMLVIAYDGVYTFEVPGRGLPQYMTGASRVDLAVRCSRPGTEILRYGISTIARITIIPGSSIGLEAKPNPFSFDGIANKKWNTLRPTYVSDLSTAVVDNYLDFYARTDDNASPPFLINNRTFYTADLNTIANNSLNDVNEWRLFGTDRHPMHLHVHHYQLLSECGNHVVGEYYDTIEGDNCLVRFGLYDFGGVTLIHCHELSHEDAGMIAVIAVSGDDTIRTTNPAVDDRKCYTEPDYRNEPESTQCFLKEASPTCRSRFLRREGRWFRLGDAGSSSCRERCITNKSFDESRNRRGWKCGRCN